MDTTSVEKMEAQLQALKQDALLQVEEDDYSKLSKALFPDSHTDTVELLGLKRTLRPLPVKYAKQLFELFFPFTKALDESTKGTPQESTMSLDGPILTAMFKQAEILAKYYKWDDVLKAAQEEELTLTELQSLSSVQSELNRSNDFLLGPLRIAIRLMQIAEIMNLKFQSTLSMQDSLKKSVAPSTS